MENIGMSPGTPVNIYRSVIYDLHPKVTAYVDELDKAGQIDHDEFDYPYLTRVEREGKNYVISLVRNNKLESFILNPRMTKVEPRRTWNEQDGYRRKTEDRTVDQSQANKPNRGERQKRVTFEAFEQMVTMMLKG